MTNRTSHTSPSVAVCFLVLSSLMTSDWMVSDSLGASAWRARSFYDVVDQTTGLGRCRVGEEELTVTFPIRSFLTGLKATPMPSVHC